jgi:hypothetical protein
MHPHNPQIFNYVSLCEMQEVKLNVGFAFSHLYSALFKPPNLSDTGVCQKLIRFFFFHLSVSVRYVPDPDWSTFHVTKF